MEKKRDHGLKTRTGSHRSRGAGTKRRADLEAASRLKGARSVDDVEYAILERNGGISIIKRQGGGGLS